MSARFFNDEMVFKCGQVQIRGWHNPLHSSFESKLLVDDHVVSEQCTFCGKPGDVFFAVRGAISFAVEEGEVDENLLEKEMYGRRWKVERVS